ncbi:MAG: hypothetical protein HKN47_06890, partial [Pirellulaceae bacterium]|nr:hypothetical protein [Pirellulaceae bacterium]
RLAGRPYLVCQAGSTQVISDYLRPITSLDNFTFLDVPVETILGDLPNEIAVHPHTDRWMSVESPQRRVVHKWVADVLATKVVTR